MKNKAFTLIELLVVVSIIGLLASITLVNLKNALAKARDTRRLEEVNQITKALEIYYSTYGHYPYNTDNDCGGWDAGNTTGDPFIQPLVSSGMTKNVPIDPVSKTNCSWGYAYYRYSAGSYGCDASRGAYYVL
ncbi:MAG TPA: prepilin-type N-terminal cleavage/methylation domain-containing protein, partial [Candidatus Parcubacteria bacterium]|nr:prepilin-type N-terminal cleavage/methylation domain-containing protein [Candidatus Parcubacteria bacterium]